MLKYTFVERTGEISATEPQLQTDYILFRVQHYRAFLLAAADDGKLQSLARRNALLKSPAIVRIEF